MTTEERRFRVVATYRRGRVERSAVIIAETPKRAAVEAIIQRKLPIMLHRDGPVFFDPEIFPEERWVTAQIDIGSDTHALVVISWGDEDDTAGVFLEVREAI